MKRPGFEADRFWIQLRDASGKVSTVASDWDRSIDDMQWSKDGKIFMSPQAMWAAIDCFKWT
ncbi:MAG: hypothetical protein IPL86_11735 [Flavobacteriales bacterium]|nr:hypothetical protein [Flavobacteriales bacterium]